jgi:GNAT superfamily N-acetyltransferase
MPRIEVIHAAGLAQVRAFYEQVRYGGGVSDADTVLAAFAGERVVGAVRLCVEHGVVVLRGMFVAPDCQRLGIGRALLGRCLPWLNRGEAFCLPYDHLVGFYARAGFEPVPIDALPSFLRERLVAYLANGQKVIGMRRPAHNHMPNKSLASRMA